MNLKNPNEAFYINGRKHFADVIKNTAHDDYLIWKQPEEDFNTNSTLIVNPGEVAVFVKDGIVVETFQNGKYVLDTNNYPFISRILNSFTGGVSQFNCRVYFFRTTLSSELRWGTSSPLQVRDKQWNIITNVRARGSYKYKIVNPSLLLNKVIGNRVEYKTQEDINNYLFFEFISIIKKELSIFLDSLECELIGLDKHLYDIENFIFPNLQCVFREYGMDCTAFNVIAIETDNNKYDEIDKSQIESIALQREAKAKKDVMNILGDSWAIQQSIDIMRDAANNQGIGGVIAGMGIGMSISGVATEVVNNIASDKKVNYKEKLLSAKEMLEDGLINNDEYQKIKDRIIEEMVK